MAYCTGGVCTGPALPAVRRRTSPCTRHKGALFGVNKTTKLQSVKKTLAKVLAIVSVMVALYTVAAIVATFTQLAAVADSIYLGAGRPLFWSLLTFFAALAIYPLVLLMRLPKAMQPPETESSEDRAAYETWLQHHLAHHPKLGVATMAANGKVPAALLVLSDEVDVLIRNTASNIFVTTSLIQNGRLDGLVMLGTQLRLIWQIGSIYNLRPSPRQLWYLYSNVGGTILVASNLEELDFAELAGPLVNSVAPSLAASLPGLQGIGNLLVNSIANGSANAFLTLRVGLIAKGYCVPVAKPERAALRKSATRAALSMLSSITQEKGSQIIRSVWSGATNAVGHAAGSVVDGAKRATSATGARVVGAVSSMAEAASEASKAVGTVTGVAGDKVVETGRSIVTKAAAASESVGTFSRDTARSVGDAVGSASVKTVDAMSSSARAVADGATTVGRSAVQGVTYAAGKVSTVTGEVMDSTAGLFIRKDKVNADGQIVSREPPL